MRLIADPSRRVRLALTTLAAEHTGAGARTTLERLVDDEDAEVRARAEIALSATEGSTWAAGYGERFVSRPRISRASSSDSFTMSPRSSIHGS